MCSHPTAHMIEITSIVLDQPLRLHSHCQKSLFFVGFSNPDPIVYDIYHSPSYMKSDFIFSPTSDLVHFHLWS